MATTAKKKAPAKKRRKTLGAKVKTKKRKTTRKKKGFLGEFFSPAGIKEAGKSSVSGFFGGGLGKVVDAIIPADTNEFVKLLIHGTGVVALGAGLGMPKMAAGWAGGYGWATAEKLEKRLLAEMDDTNYAEDDVLEDCPDGMDENGNAMYLAEDGNFYYLEDFELADDGNMYLAASFQSNDMYPQYVNSSQF